jgi:hypothetical protein
MTDDFGRHRERDGRIAADQLDEAGAFEVQDFDLTYGSDTGRARLVDDQRDLAEVLTAADGSQAGFGHAVRRDPASRPICASRSASLASVARAGTRPAYQRHP